MIQIRARPALGVAMVLGGGVLFAVNGTVAKLVLGAGIDAPQLTTLRARYRWSSCTGWLARDGPGSTRPRSSDTRSRPDGLGRAGT